MGEGLILETPRKKRTWKQRAVIWVLFPTLDRSQDEIDDRSHIFPGRRIIDAQDGQSGDSRKLFQKIGSQFPPTQQTHRKMKTKVPHGGHGFQPSQRVVVGDPDGLHIHENEGVDPLLPQLLDPCDTVGPVIMHLESDTLVLELVCNLGSKWDGQANDHHGVRDGLRQRRQRFRDLELDGFLQFEHLRLVV